MENQDEIFKKVEGYNGKYAISNLGVVKRSPWVFTKPKSLNVINNNKGFDYVNLIKGERSKRIMIHELMVVSFIDPKYKPNKNKIINHINSIKTDNRLSNIEIITALQYKNKDIKPVVKLVKKKHIGVTWLRVRKKWMVEALIGGNRHYIGCYKTEQEGIEAYNKAVNDNST
jgi:hypothetical protein